jgi:hypothetical protein
MAMTDSELAPAPAIKWRGVSEADLAWELSFDADDRTSAQASSEFERRHMRAIKGFIDVRAGDLGADVGDDLLVRAVLNIQRRGAEAVRVHHTLRVRSTMDKWHATKASCHVRCRILDTCPRSGVGAYLVRSPRGTHRVATRLLARRTQEVPCRRSSVGVAEMALSE